MTATATETPTSSPTETPVPTCGDGKVNQPAEQCDPPDDSACPGHCQPDCTCCPAPTITSIDPLAGSVGTQLTITGLNLDCGGAANVTLSCGGRSLVPTLLTATSIRTVIAPGADDCVISLTTPGGTAFPPGAPSFDVVPSADFSVAAVPASAHVIRGQSASYSVALDSSNGFIQLATLYVAGLPSGMTASFKPQLITAGQHSVLTVGAAANQPLGLSMLKITAAAKVDGLDVMASAHVAITVDPVTTSFMGRTVVADTMETPLAGVTIAFLGRDGSGDVTACTGQSTMSDAAGNFAFTNLPAACTGAQLIRYDGLTTTDPPGQYAGVDLVYAITAGQVTVSPVLVHLPRIDDKETVLVQQNAAVDQTFDFNSIPRLSITVYAGTIFTLVDGTQPNPFPLTAVQVPIDRLPDAKPPNPSMVMVFIVAFQPADAEASQPVAVTFPNSINTSPGLNMVLMTLDPTRGQMVPYGTGTVSNDGTQVIPDLDPARPGHRFGLVHFDWHGQMPPGPNKNPPPPCSDCACARREGAKPIDPTSGIEVLTETDISIAGLRGELSLQRTYRTLSAEAGPFGIGTNHNYGYRLNTNSPQGAAVVSLVMPDGNRFPFARGAGGTLTNSTIPALRAAVLSVAANGQSDLRFKNGTVFHFVPSTFQLGSFLESITDANGNRTMLTRDPARPARITGVTDPVGRALVFDYDSADRITMITDPIGRTVRYTYNAQGTLETVTDPEGGITRYDYDAQNRLKRVTDARGVVVAENTYDANGWAIEQRLADGGRWHFDYTPINPLMPTSPFRQTVGTDPSGNQTTYRFNPQGYLLDVTDALGQTRVFEREAGTNLLLAVRGIVGCATCGGLRPGDETLTYDANGNQLTRTDALGNTTTYTYEPTFNKVASTTDALGHVTQFTYDARGNLLTVTDPLGHSTSFTYDPAGLLQTVTDALGNARTLTHDALGNLSGVADPLGNTSTLAYDAVSRLTAQTDPRGKTTHFAYDGLGRIVRIVDALNGTTQFGYDRVGNLLTVTDALNHATAYAYDGGGLIARRTDPVGAFETFERDPAGNLTRHTDRKGQVATFSYDALNRRGGAAYADAMVTFTYDARGRLIQASDTAAEGDILRTYDSLDRLVEERTNLGTVAYVYDALGRRIRMNVTGQDTVNYEYDESSRLTRITQGSQVVDFEYDDANRRTKLALPNGVSTEYRYDAASRLIELTYRNTAGLLGNLTYEYDAASNRTRVGGTFARALMPDPIASATYDDANRQLRFGDRDMSFDDNGNLANGIGPMGITILTWDTRNRLVGRNRSGMTSSFTYDVLGRRTSKRGDTQLT